MPEFNNATPSIPYFEKTFSMMNESIRDLQKTLSINKEMLKNILSSGIDDETISATFYKITDENTKLIKDNQRLTKERDIALFKSQKAAFEIALAPIIPKSEDVRRFESHTIAFRSEGVDLCSPQVAERKEE